VQSLIHQRISVGPGHNYELQLSTEVYSILADQGVNQTVSIETMSADFTTTLSDSIEAIRVIDYSKAAVVLWIFRGETGNNERFCREMSERPHLAFVFPAGSDGEGHAIDPEQEPHCLAKNILFVAALDQDRDRLASFSNYGTAVRLAAPGINIPVVGQGGIRSTRSGVTPALAFAAAQLSVYEQAHPDLRGETLIESFLKHATLTLPDLKGKIEGSRAIKSSPRPVVSE
jgi:hypothetical protein